MKRILIAISCMPADGAETFIMKIMRNIDRTKYHIDFVVSVTEEYFYDKEIVALGGNIYRVTAKSKSYSKFKKDMKKLLAEEKFDAIFRLGTVCQSSLDLWIAKKAKVPIRVMRSCNASGNYGVLSGLFHKLFKVPVNSVANVKIAPSPEAGIFTFGKRAVKKGKVHILHNGLTYDNFAYSESSREDIRKELGLQDKFVIGHVGRFNQQKNHKFLVEAFAKIAEKREDAILLLLGKGELIEQVKEQVERLGLAGKVIFAGVRGDVGKVLSAFDVFMFPSFYEGMPNTVIEAQANGLYCVVADTITKEADITGRVKYLPIDKGIDCWVEEILNAPTDRKDTRQDFIDNKYDIDSVVKEFTKLLFGDKE